MRVHFALKTVAVVALGLTSSLLTSTVISHAKRARAEEAQSPAPSTTTITSEHQVGQQAQLAGEVEQSILSGRLNLLDYTTEGDRVHIAAKGFLRDLRPGVRWVWCARVTDPNDKSKVLFEKIYQDQVFTAIDPQGIPLAFEDIVKVPLPKGKYLLDFAIHEVPPGDTVTVKRDRPGGGNGLRGPKALVHIRLNP